MNRRFIVLLILLSTCLVLTGCGDAKSQSASVQSSPDSSSSVPASVPEEQAPASLPEDASASSAQTLDDTVTRQPSTPIDVDLTVLSSTIVYGEVYNMMITPEDYVGKTVKMRGAFAIYQTFLPDGTPDPDDIYFACVIADATACCVQGIEFLWSGEHVYPDDYPALDSEITVTGEFQTYTEDGFLYCHLIDAELSY